MATAIERATAVMQALSDSTPSNPTMLKYVQAFWDHYGPGVYPSGHPNEGEPIDSPTNAELARFYIYQIRQHHKAILKANRIPAAADAARAAESATVDAEIGNELGTD